MDIFVLALFLDEFRTGETSDEALSQRCSYGIDRFELKRHVNVWMFTETLEDIVYKS